MSKQNNKNSKDRLRTVGTLGETTTINFDLPDGEIYLPSREKERGVPQALIIWNLQRPGKQGLSWPAG
jgi:hypothetical protein